MICYLHNMVTQVICVITQVWQQKLSTRMSHTVSHRAGEIGALWLDGWKCWQWITRRMSGETSKRCLGCLPSTDDTGSGTGSCLYNLKKNVYLLLNRFTCAEHYTFSVSRKKVLLDRIFPLFRIADKTLQSGSWLPQFSCLPLRLNCVLALRIEFYQVVD